MVVRDLAVLGSSVVERAARVGLRFIHLPMLPWLSDNGSALQAVRELAQSGTGPYYVHCYLGKDRVLLVKQAIEQEGVAVDDRGIVSGRTIEDRAFFERGPVYSLGRVGYLTPLPTDEEFLNYVLGSEIQTVVSLLDPEHPGESLQVDQDRRLMTQHGLGFESLAIPARGFEPATILEIGQRVRELPQPVVVYGRYSVSPRSKAFLWAFRTGLPPLHSALTSRRLQAGKTSLLAPHAAIGPRPLADEFSEPLFRLGVRHCIYIGEWSEEIDREDRALAARAGIRFEVMGADTRLLLDRLRQGGPYYLYGPAAEEIEEDLREGLGPVWEAIREGDKG